MLDRLPKKFAIFCRDEATLKRVLEILDEKNYAWADTESALAGLEWIQTPAYIYAEDNWLSFDTDDDYFHRMTKFYGYIELTPDAIFISNSLG